MRRLKPQKIQTFRDTILNYYTLHGRHTLPFRNTRNPYRIMVSELMLQQTQVDRVVPFYTRWITRWPNWKSLASATTKELLALWSGLGYNRRALYLRTMATIIVRTHRGRTPKTIEVLESLPGVGPYTARAILIFAYNKDVVTVDTNIRRVLIHELHLDPGISMNEIWDIALQVLPNGKSRDWHNALMDYASLALPKTPHIKPLSRQSPFKGSVRQIRGEIIRQLTQKKHVSYAAIARNCSCDTALVRRAAHTLEQERIILTMPRFMRLIEER